MKSVRPEPVPLTTQGIASTNCPADKKQILVPVKGIEGACIRARPRKRGTDQKTLVVPYRTPGGRAGQQRWYKIADLDAITPKDAKAAAVAVLGRIAKGEDPAGERKAQAKRNQRRLGAGLDAYEADLECRRAVKRKEVLSLLRREMLGRLGNIDLREIDRATFASHVRKVEASGRPGAAKELKTRASVFLGWCVDEGLIMANPLAGWRRKRATRAERVERPGRALDDWELPIFWKAATETAFPFGPYLKILLLLGQRRTETSLMAWPDIDLVEGVWTVPPAITKSGRPHKIPIPRQAVEILQGLPRMAKTDLVFPGRRNYPMSGWSKRLPPVYKLTAAAEMPKWEPHDLRRTMRTGLGKLGVDRVIAELLLDHAVSDELAKIYDRHEYWQQRVEASSRWAAHVMGLVDGPNKVVPLRQAR